MKTTGPILAIGAITLGNRVLFHDKPMEWKIPIATGIAAGMFSLAEKAWPKGAVALAWVALVTVLLSRVDPNVPAPAETVADWWRKQ